MSDNVYKKIELTGSSRESIEDAVQGAISEAAKTVKHIRWFEVTELRGHVEDDKVAHWQITMKVGFRVGE